MSSGIPVILVYTLTVPMSDSSLVITSTATSFESLSEGQFTTLSFTPDPWSSSILSLSTLSSASSSAPSSSSITQATSPASSAPVTTPLDTVTQTTPFSTPPIVVPSSITSSLTPTETDATTSTMVITTHVETPVDVSTTPQSIATTSSGSVAPIPPAVTPGIQKQVPTSVTSSTTLIASITPQAHVVTLSSSTPTSSFNTYTSTTLTSTSTPSSITTSHTIVDQLLTDIGTVQVASTNASSTISPNTGSPTKAALLQDGQSQVPTSSSGDTELILGQGLLTSVASSTASSSDSQSTSIDDSQSIYVSGTVTLTGSAAVAAGLAAAANTAPGSMATLAAGDSGSTTTSGSRLSSVAIIGIVAGVLVFFVVVYIGWYQWRKRKLALAKEDQDQVDEVPTRHGRYQAKIHYDEYGNRLHSGFDFSDEPVSGGGPRRSGRGGPSLDPDPSGDGDGSHKGETWYENPFAGEDHPVEEGMHSDRGAGSADRRRSGLEELDDEELNDFEENLKTGKTGIISRRGGTSTVGRSLSSRGHIDDQLHHVERPASSHRRPTTSHSQADSFNYGDFYDGYDHPSRPDTHHDPAVLDDVSRQSSMYDPATSTLLPWLSNENGTQTAAPPVPSIPSHLAQNARDARERQHQRPRPLSKREINPGDLITRDQGMEKGRHPPRAVMAMTPAPQFERQGDNIPSFR